MRKCTATCRVMIFDFLTTLASHNISVRQTAVSRIAHVKRPLKLLVSTTFIFLLDDHENIRLGR